MPCYLPKRRNRFICFSRCLISAAWQLLPVCLLLLCCFSLLDFFLSSSRPQPREDLYNCRYLLFLLPSSISGLFPPPAEATSCQQFGFVVEAQRQKLDSLLCPESPHMFFLFSTLVRVAQRWERHRFQTLFHLLHFQVDPRNKALRKHCYPCSRATKVS